MQIADGADRPRLAPHVRLAYDQARERHVLLTPETVTLLNGTGAAILGLCDGMRTEAQILAELRGRYDRVADAEVRAFLNGLLAKRCVEVSHG
ncbi:MAG TPA: pyrroloquinoline quinone biosynthesis peptide chaperone PqqD [Trebonia sp.]|jgi:pyrroloquinoline quinone biosynthesis protein D